MHVIKKIEMKTIGLSGKSGDEIKRLSDYIVKIPTVDTQRIQDADILIGYILWKYNESKNFSR